MKYLTLALILIFLLSAKPVLSATDVKNDANLSTNLISYWRLETATAATTTDSHGSNTLTDVNTVQGATPCVQSSCVDVELSNFEYLRVNDNTTLPLSSEGDDISACLWFYAESLGDGGWNGLIQHYLQSGNQRSWSFYIGGSGTNMTVELSTAGNTTDTVGTEDYTFSLSTWYHVCFTYDVSAGEIKFYVNGAQDGATDTGLSTSYHNSTARLLIGNFYDNGSTAFGRFDGLIDDVGLWQKVLTSTEISELYNSGAGIPYEAPASASSRNQNITIFE